MEIILLHTHFIIYTDHQSMKYFLEKPMHAHLQRRWLSKLMVLDYELKYKESKENKVGRCFSRVAHSIRQNHIISIIQPKWLTKSINSYADDTKVQSILTKLIIGPTSVSGYVLDQGLLRKDGKLM